VGRKFQSKVFFTAKAPSSAKAAKVFIGFAQYVVRKKKASH